MMMTSIAADANATTRRRWRVVIRALGESATTTRGFSPFLSFTTPCTHTMRARTKTHVADDYLQCAHARV
jgi:hypothetical protein